MFRKNNFFFGFGLAFLITAAGFGFLYILNDLVLNAIFHRIILSNWTKLLAALAVNFFVLNWYAKHNLVLTARGIVAFTFACAAYMLYDYFVGGELGLHSSEY